MSETKLRVSVATLDQVIFSHPQDGTLMLALERKATILKDGRANVRAQPLGGGIRILDSSSLEAIVGEIQFDSERSKHEQDFRILIPSPKWELVKQYCLSHLENSDDLELESTPHRELFEEFKETLHINLNSNQYTFQPMGFVIEDNPVPTDNVHAYGLPTVRLYRIFEVHIVDSALCKTILAVNEQYSDDDLGILASNDSRSGGKGWENSILALPLNTITESYLALPPEKRYGKITIENHELDESVLAVLGDIESSQYRRT